MEKLMDMASVPDLRDRVLIPVAGITDSKFLEFTLGQVARLTRDNGRTVKGTALAWKPVDVGFIVENGLKDSKDVTVLDNLRRPRRDTRVHGLQVSKMVTARRHTPTAELTKDNGFVV